MNQGYTDFHTKISKSDIDVERIRHTIQNPSVHGYNSVMRSTIFKGEAKLLTKIKYVKNIFFIELILNIFINSKGKSKFIKNLAWFRSFENNWIQTNSWNRNTKFQNSYLWIKRQSKNKIRHHIEILAKEINLLKFQNLSLLIEENLYNYLFKFLNNFNYKSKKKNNILKFIKTKIKKNYLIYNLLKLILSIIRVKESNIKVDNLEIFLLSNKIQYKKKTLRSVIKIINNFHRENNFLN